VSKPKPIYADLCHEFQVELAFWAIEERRSHDVYDVFADEVWEYAKGIPLAQRLRLRHWRSIVAEVTDRAWAAEVDPPEEELEPEAEQFMAELRRESRGF